MHEAYFRYSEDPVKKKIWQQRIEPYIENEPVYQTVNLNSIGSFLFDISFFGDFTLIVLNNLI